MPVALFLPTRFVVDTGAELSVLSPPDVRRLLREVSDVNQRLEALPRVRVSGVGSPEYASCPAVFAFVHEDGLIQTLDTSALCTFPSMPTPLASLLGCNVLEQFTLRMLGPTAEVVLE